MKNSEDRLFQNTPEKLNIIMDHCPSCYETLSLGAQECSFCGVVLANYRRVSLEKRLKLTIGGLYHLTSAECEELETAWNKIESVYYNNDMHNQFIHKCLRLKSLPYAVKKYTDRLAIDANDDIAHVMKKRVMVLAAESLPQTVFRETFMPPVLATALTRSLMVMLVLGVCAGSVLMLVSVLTTQRFFFFGMGVFLTVACLLSYTLLRRLRLHLDAH